VQTFERIVKAHDELPLGQAAVTVMWDLRYPLKHKPLMPKKEIARYALTKSADLGHVQ
jgi:hypothetical protein